MKYFKIFMLMMATVAFAACSSDDDGWNGSGDAVVSMANQEITWKENKGSSTPVYVPITVTGERNGNVQVTVQVKETGENPAMDDIHYIITSKTIVIPADATQGKIELRTIDDMDINDNRTFTMTIVDAKGATISSSNASTLITLKDNDSEFYEKMMGTWKLEYAAAGTDGSTDTPATWSVSISGYDEGEEGYNEMLYLSGFDQEEGEVEFLYEFDKASGKGRVGFMLPSSFFAAYNFTGIGPHYLALCGYKAGSGWINEETVLWGTWNDDFSVITFEDAPLIGERLYTYPAGDPTGYRYGLYKIIKMTR